MPHHREGPVLNKSTGYYFFDQSVFFGEARKRVRFSLHTKNPARAQFLWENEYKRLYADHYGLTGHERVKKTMFSQIIKEFADYERDIKKVIAWKTIKARLRIISGFFGPIALDEIDSKKLFELDIFLKSINRSPKTINLYMGLLKSLFYYAIRKKLYYGDNPISELKPYIVDDKRREYSPDEINRILSAADSIEKTATPHSIVPKYAKRIVLLLLYTGMRTGELLNLKWDNIQGNKIVLKRTETKQQKEKIIPVSQTIRELLESMRDRRRTDGYVIPRPGGRKLRSGGSTRSLIAKMKKLTGIPDFDLHSIRHTASTIMVSHALGKGVGLADIMKILGHSKVETTMRYIHADQDRMRLAITILEEKAIVNKQNDVEKPTPKE